MKKVLNILFEHKNLDKATAKQVMLSIGKGAYNEAEVAAFVTVYLMRSITIQELEGFREALLEMCLPIKLEQEVVTDIVGTGGDGKNTFNISTLSCFIVAGAGYKVAKHGNYGVSTISGSSNVMENLGYKFSNSTDKIQKEITETNISFLHAPLFHPALKVVAGVRKNLGLRTFFNMLGPVVNPSQPSHQVIGVYSLEIARYYNYLLQNSKTEFAIIHTLDGYDEISLTDDAKVINRIGEHIYAPEYLGKRTVKLADIGGGNTVDDAAAIFLTILKGAGSWSQNAVVLANAAIAIQNLNTDMSYKEAFDQSIKSLESGKAYEQFKKLILLQS
jgi:anthranilate phosphoribosyltransferase